MRRTVIYVIVCLLLYNSIAAQEYIFNHLTTKDGLASNFINCLWQDKQGYLWIGTESGLQRYDGYTFLYPFYGGDNELPEQPIHQMMEDKNGRLWLRMNKTVGIFNTSTFQYHSVPVHFKKAAGYTNDYHLERDAEGNIFLIINGYNWFYYNPRTAAFEEDSTPFKIPYDFGLLTVFDDAVNNVTWLGGLKGIALYDKQKKQLYDHVNNPINNALLKDARLNENVVQFYIDSKRRYWIVNWQNYTGGSFQNFTCYNEATKTYSTDTSGTAYSHRGYFQINHFTQFADSVLIVYGGNCLMLNTDHRFENFADTTNTTYSIEYDNVNDVMEDRDQLLWVATDNGLYNTLSNTGSQHLTLDPHKPPASITSVMQLANGNIWLGTWGRGVLPLGKTIYENDNVSIYKNAPRGDADYTGVWCIHEHTKKGTIWVGCQAGKLIIYNPYMKQSKFLVPKIFNHSTVRAIAEDKDGNLWFGCQNGTLVKWSGGSDISDASFIKIDNLNTLISKLFVNNKNQLWISTGGRGIIVVDAASDKIIKSYLAGHSLGTLSDNYIRSIVQLNDSIYGIAGDVLNLLNYHTGYIKQCTSFAGLPLGKILTLQTDKYNQFWVSTPNGIFKYNAATDNFTSYSQTDGLITVLNNSYLMETSTRLQNGDMVFAGNSNLVQFNPDQFKNEHPPVDVNITSFILFDQYLPVDSLLHLKKIELNHNQNSITIKFASLSFTQIDKLSYYYKLEGADKDWRRADQLQAAYNLLPPGNYTFLVRSQTDEGTFSKNITALHIAITPSFWQSIWFYLLLGLATAGLLYYLHRLRIQRLLQVEKVRTRLARDLHDDMGSTLSTISILSNIAYKKADTDNGTAKEYISRISDSSSRMMEAMDDIVWSINPANDSMSKVAARMKEFAGNVLEAKDIAYNFHIDEAAKELSFDMETRRSIFLIFKEAINNIVKYSQCTEVDINMLLQKKYLIVIIGDNGVGFDPMKQVAAHRGNGMKNMQKRAEAMKGIFTVQTAPGKGTTLQLNVPA